MWRLWQLFTMAPWHFLNKFLTVYKKPKTVKVNWGTFRGAVVECNPLMEHDCELIVG